MKTIIVLVILLLLTSLTALAANVIPHAALLRTIILGLALTKLLLVAFQFMELKKAHLFWRSSLVVFSLIFVTIISLIQ